MDCCCALCFQVSATFAASLVTSPAIGAYLSANYSDSLVVLIATIIAVVDILFVLLVVPESLPDKMRLSSWGFPISWEQADPFGVSFHTRTNSSFCLFVVQCVISSGLLTSHSFLQSLRKVGKDTTVLLICVTVFLSYLPEAGQYSSFFLYLRQVSQT